MTRRCRRRAGGADEGFTLIEVMASMVVFALFASAAGAVLINSIKLMSQNRNRVVAAQLAARQVETLRGQATTALPVGLTALSDISANGATFHLQQEVAFVNSSGVANACNSTSSDQLGFKRLSVVVTWDNMGTVAPVRSDSLKVISIAGADATKGAVAVNVLDVAGNPAANRTVTLAPGGLSQVTGTDGCVVFAGVTPASGYSVTLGNGSAFVDKLGNQPPTMTGLTVTAAQISEATLDFGTPSTLQLSWAARAGYSVPTSILPVTLTNNYFPNNGTKAFLDCGATQGTGCAFSTPRTITNLFPSPLGYGAYAGTCTDAAPPSATAALNVTAGQTTAGTVTLGAAWLTVKKKVSNSTVLATNTPIYAVHAADSGGCTTGQSILLGTTNASGVLKVQMPYGTWKVSSNSTATGTTTSGSATWPTVTPTAASPAATSTVTI